MTFLTILYGFLANIKYQEQPSTETEYTTIIEHRIKHKYKNNNFAIFVAEMLTRSLVFNHFTLV